MKRRPYHFQYVSEEEDREITHLLQEAMEGNAKSIAFAIGCDYQDLLNRVSNQPRSPRKIELILRILDQVNNPEPFLRWFTQRYDFLPVKIPNLQLEVLPLHKQMTRVGKEMGDVSRELLKAEEDNIIKRGELIRLKKEIMDVIQTALGLELAIEQKFKEDNHVKVT